MVVQLKIHVKFIGSVRKTDVSSCMCLFIRLVQICLELSIFIFLAQISFRFFFHVSHKPKSHSGLTLLSTLSAYFVGQTEPKILRLVKTRSVDYILKESHATSQWTVSSLLGMFGSTWPRLCIICPGCKADYLYLITLLLPAQ